MSKKKLEADHSATLNSMAYLALTYRNQGRGEVAEELDVEVMEMRKKKLGADHPDSQRAQDMGRAHRSLLGDYHADGAFCQSRRLPLSEMTVQSTSSTPAPCFKTLVHTGPTGVRVS